MILRDKLTSTSGIYQIESKVNGKIYIGSAVNFLSRRRHHMYKLKRNSHFNQILQNHFNKYGQEDLEFSIIEFCPKEKLIEREQYWIDKIKPEFNICKVAGNTLGIFLREESKQKLKQNYFINHPIESFKKQGLSLKEKWKDPDFRIKQNESRQKAINDPIRKKRRKENRQLFWQSVKGKTLRQELSKKRKGVSKTKEHLNKCSISIKKFYQSSKGMKEKEKKRIQLLQSKRLQTKEVILKRCKRVNQYTKDLIFIKTYYSIIEASRQVNIHKNLISACICNTQKTAGGFIWKRA